MLYLARVAKVIMPAMSSSHRSPLGLIVGSSSWGGLVWLAPLNEAKLEFPVY